MTPKAKPEPEPESDKEDVGPCVAIPKGKSVTALAVHQVSESWESFTYSDSSVRRTFTSTRFEVKFVSHDERCQVIVTGRKLGRTSGAVLRHRCEWIRSPTATSRTIASRRF